MFSLYFLIKRVWTLHESPTTMFCLIRLNIVTLQLHTSFCSLSVIYMVFSKTYIFDIFITSHAKVIPHGFLPTPDFWRLRLRRHNFFCFMLKRRIFSCHMSWSEFFFCDCISSSFSVSIPYVHMPMDFKVLKLDTWR